LCNYRAWTDIGAYRAIAVFEKALGSVGELYMRLAYIITRTEHYAAKPLNINFSGFAGLVRKN
jgi:hypothetical protein